ncbi:MAG: FAD-dependent oxidoreductase [Nocardioidaceae bacterium]
MLDIPEGAEQLGSRETTGSLSTRLSLAKLLRKTFKDERLRSLVDQRFRLGGSDPKDIPAFAAVDSYVERSFGVWDVVGGMASLTTALVTRLEERSVDLRLECEIAALTVTDSTVVGVETVAGKAISADVVITDIDPRAVFRDLLPASPALPGRQIFESATPAIPVGVTHLGLKGEVPALPAEVVLHGEPLLVLSTTGLAPVGHHAWTVLRRGSAQEDVLLTMARRRIDVRDRVVTRIDRSPIELLHETAGSSYGLAWAGWRAHTQRAAQSHPLPGLYLIGASMHPGPSIPYVAWGAAHVAARIGKA